MLARIKELYDQNLSSKEIQDTLNDDGWELDDYRFNSLRRRNGVLMRGKLGYKPHPEKQKKRKAPAADVEHQDTMGGQLASETAVEANGDGAEASSVPPPMPPEEAARRAQRVAELHAESERLMQTRKRRRRLRDRGPVAADAPGMAPRYMSELSLDECKILLHLSNDVYVQTRADFEALCRENGVIKMSHCVDGVWQSMKDRLVRESAHLSAVLHPLQPDLERKTVALNCICIDTTKRMRMQEKYMTIPDANNVLGLGPVPSKELRRILYEILETNHFTTVVTCGLDFLEALRQQWYAQSDVLQAVIAENNPQKLKAIAVLDRDVRKRFNGDRAAKDPSVKQWSKSNHEGPGPAMGKVSKQPRRSKGSTPVATSDNTAAPTQPTQDNATGRMENFNTASRRSVAPVGPAWDGNLVPEYRSTTIADLVPPINFDLDPALEDLGRPKTGPIWPPMSSNDAATRQADPISVSDGQYINVPSASTAPVSIPAYFRLSPHSSIVGNHPRMWLGKLITQTMAAVHAAATSKAGATRVAKVHGVVKSGNETEDSWLIESDDELQVYLGEVGEKATFVVVLEAGYA